MKGVVLQCIHLEEKKKGAIFFFMSIMIFLPLKIRLL